MAEKHLSDTWERGDPYEQYMGRWSRQIAPRFLTWLSIPEGWRWLDVGCGTGALTAAILDHCTPAAVTGVEPSQGFLNQAKNRLADRVEFYQGNAEAIPLDSSSVDVTVSGLSLNFVPNQNGGACRDVTCDKEWGRHWRLCLGLRREDGVHTSFLGCGGGARSGIGGAG